MLSPGTSGFHGLPSYWSAAEEMVSGGRMQGLGRGVRGATSGSRCQDVTLFHLQCCRPLPRVQTACWVLDCCG